MDLGDLQPNSVQIEQLLLLVLNRSSIPSTLMPSILVLEKTHDRPFIEILLLLDKPGTGERT